MILDNVCKSKMAVLKTFRSAVVIIRLSSTPRFYKNEHQKNISHENLISTGLIDRLID